MLGCADGIIALSVRKYSHNYNHISAHVSVKWPLTPLRKMIYESASPLGPALPLQFSSCFHAHYIDTFRIFIYPELQFHHTEELFFSYSLFLQELQPSLIVNGSEVMPPLLCVEVLRQRCSSNYTPPPSTLPLLSAHRSPPTAPSHTARVPPLFPFCKMGVWGKQRRFSCANVSQSAPSNHRPVFSRDQGLRHSLNNLAALCHRALGSQPSKVMTERRWLTSPPIHSHYHLFTVPDSRQTKQKATLGGGKRNHRRCINCVIKQSTTKQWHFHSLPESLAFPPRRRAAKQTRDAHEIIRANRRRQRRWWTHMQRKGREVTRSRDRCQRGRISPTYMKGVD